MTDFIKTVSGTLLSYIQTPLEIQPTDPKPLQYAKLVAGTVVFPVFVVAGIVEGIVRAIFGLLAKGITFFLPKDFPYIEQIDAAVTFILHSACINLVAVPIVAIIDLLQGFGTIGKKEALVSTQVKEGLRKDIAGESPPSLLIDALGHAHINGSSSRIITV
jgi:hypothetical protein